MVAKTKAASPLADDQPAATANPHRGECAVMLAGTRYVLRPDFEAISAIDAELGGILALARRGMNDPGDLTLHELAVIVAEGIKASGRAARTNDAHVKTDKIKRLIFETGIPAVVPGVVRFLVASVTGGSKAEPGEAGND